MNGELINKRRNDLPMDSVVYMGPLRIVKTRYGKFVRGRRGDLESVMAKEVLKIPGFERATFAGRYIGRAESRSLQIQGREILVCYRGRWTAIPIALQYKIRMDKDFEVGPANISAKALIVKQETDIKRKKEAEDRKKRVAESQRRRLAPIPVPVPVVQPKPEKKVVKIRKLNLPSRVVTSLQAAGINTVDELPKNLVSIKGIGTSSAAVIRRAVREL